MDKHIAALEEMLTFPHYHHFVAHELEAITAAIALMRGQSWQPIETAPKDGRTILVGRDMGNFGFVRGYAYFCGDGDAYIHGWISNGFTDPPGNLGLAHPTHWMPLPAPPKDPADEQ